MRYYQSGTPTSVCSPINNETLATTTQLPTMTKEVSSYKFDLIQFNVKRLPSTSFAFQFSTLKGSVCTKFCVTGSWEIRHHVFRWLIPWSVRSVSASSVPLLFWSRPDRAGIYEHSPQPSVNCIHIFRYFLLLPIQCRCTLTWRWSCLWRAQVHTLGLSLDFESSRGGPTLWFLWIFFHSNSVGMPSIRFISLTWLFSEYHLILLFQVTIGSSPKLHCTINLSSSTWVLWN